MAYHRGIDLVTHPKVKLYKRRAMELMAAAEVKQKVSSPRSITADVNAFKQQSSNAFCGGSLLRTCPCVSERDH